MTQVAASFISKKQFCEIIELLRGQYVADKKHSEAFSEMFGGGEVGLYDNSRIIKACMILLREFFPVDKNGFCAIEHYCYCLDFGKLGEEYESAEEFYKRLKKQNLKIS